jgi:hypothetical protein
MKYHNQIIKVTAVIGLVTSLAFFGEVNAQRVKHLGQVMPVPDQNPSWGVIPKASPRPAPKPTPKPPRTLPNPKPPGPPANPQNPSYFKINLNHQEQEYMLCVPTSASIMLDKFGWNYPPRQIKLATLRKPWYGQSTPFNNWTPMSIGDLFRGFDYLGIKNWRIGFYDSTEFDIGLNDIKESIRQGNPVMIIVTYGGPVGHAMAVCGYDDANQRLIINDPANRKPGIVYYSYSDLRDKHWLTWGYRMVVYMNQQLTTTLNRPSSFTSSVPSNLNNSIKRLVPPEVMKKLLETQLN